MKTTDKLVEFVHLPSDPKDSDGYITRQSKKIVQSSPNADAPERSAVGRDYGTCDRCPCEGANGDDCVACGVVTTILLSVAEHANAHRR